MQLIHYNVSGLFGILFKEDFFGVPVISQKIFSMKKSFFLKHIIYLEAQANYTQIFLQGGIKLMASRTLKEYEELLPPEMFVRIHHSYIININCVEKYIRGDGGQVVLSNKAVLDVAKRKKHEFLKAINY